MRAKCNKSIAIHLKKENQHMSMLTVQLEIEEEREEIKNVVNKQLC